jgi:ribonucleoside-diphosphate reductase alpha chain
MDWDHPDIDEFVNAKRLASVLASFIQGLPSEIQPAQNPVLSNMNISVNVTDEFWEPENKELLESIAHNMWETGDPGLLFIDNMIRYSPFHEDDNPRFSNPCGEYLAAENTACNLLTINVGKIARMVYNEPGVFDHKSFLKTVMKTAELACYYGSMIIEMDEGYPLEDIREASQRLKPVGIGMSGFHTALILSFDGMVPYGSERACEYAEDVQSHLTFGTLLASTKMAHHFRHIYRNSDYWSEHLEELEKPIEKVRVATKEEIFGVHMQISKYGGFYNVCTTSQAPTGSVSQFLRNIDTGIEPFFSVDGVKRRVRDMDENWRTYVLYPLELYDLITTEGDCVTQLSQNLREQTTEHISPEEQLQMLAAFQKYCHTGVSKTINAPNSTTLTEIIDLIKKAKDYRLKGFTLYRLGSRDQVLSTAKEPKGDPLVTPAATPKLSARRSGETYTVKGPLTAYLTLNRDDEERVREIFIQAGNVGTTLNSMFAAVGMILSVGLRTHPSLVHKFIHTLSKIQAGEFFSCDPGQGEEVIRGNSLPDLLSKILKDTHAKYQKSNDVIKKSVTLVSEIDMIGTERTGDFCPNCHNLSLMKSGGCKDCFKCGHNTC